MAGLLYFLPKLHGLAKADLAKYGLAGVFGAAGPVFRGTADGPGKEAGIVFSIGKPGAGDPSPSYVPAKQRWEKAKTADYWLGVWEEKPPTPEALLRDENFVGHWVQLTDGNRWLVPVARLCSGQILMPQSLSLGPDGGIVKAALPRFAKFCADGERVWSQFLDENKTELELQLENFEPHTLKEQWGLAIEALALNYHIGPEEVSFLGLLTTHNIRSVLQAVIDIPTLEVFAKARAQEELKKKDALTPAGSSTAPGAEESSPTTSPPGQTSPPKEE